MRMLRITGFAVFAAALCAASPAPARGDAVSAAFFDHAQAVRKIHKRAARETVEALEQQWREAQLAGDTAVMERLLADDFVGINPAGQVNTKSQTLERMRNRSITFSQLEVFDSRIKISGRVAIVTSQFRVVGTAEGRPMSGSFRSTRIYQEQAGGSWKITNFEATRESPAHNAAPRDDGGAPPSDARGLPGE